MTLADRTRSLLDLVEQERARQCGALLDEATAQAQTLQAQSRAQAQERLRQVFAEERAQMRLRLAAARAELQTRRRVSAQRRLESLLALAWQRLPESLVARWREPSARAAWVAATLDAARRLLPPGEWRVVHAPDWPEAERAACVQAPHALRFEADAQIAAGLRVEAAGNVVDATLEALLADRDEIGGRLVERLE